MTGRPSSYKPEYAKQAAKLCKLGATDADLADFFEVNTSTIWRWTGRYEDFCNALKAGKSEADDRVERSLYQKAVGYEYDAVKIFNANGSPMVVPYREKIAPDTTAGIFWLKNRRSDQWRDKQEVEHGVNGDLGALLSALDGKNRRIPTSG
jgi:basic membrane lipoprotein Med (substrate-binding protein (PBP1-ABC) superfamily)